jgi:uncharacterized protein GlcG (DUF336 family)
VETDDEAPACRFLVEEWGGGALPAYSALTLAEVRTILGQAVEQATADGAPVVAAVVDREGFVLGVFAMTAAPLGPVFPVPATLAPDAAPGINAAIAKARTAAALSSNENAFTTVTAAFIVDAHFPPGVRFTPGGPLYGVQNSNDTGSDVVPGLAANATSSGPLPDPNGFSGAPGGLPLYKGGWLVGGVGVSGGADEKAAVAATRGFMAPHAIRACEILVEGFRLEFANVAPPFVVASLPFGALPGMVADPVTQGPGAITPGAAPPTYASATLGGVTGQLVHAAVDSPTVASPKLLAADVTAMLSRAAAEMNRVRAAIRAPYGRRAQVTTAVVDTAGNILGAFRPADCTRFSLDLAVQKARTAVVYSDATVTPALGEPLAGLPAGAALTTRAAGFMAQPFYPPGIDGTAPGPLFGIQDALPGGLGAGIPGLDVTPGSVVDATNGNGITIFPGGIPLYKAGVLVGGIGVSGDGVDQDDLIAFAGAAGFRPPGNLKSDEYFVQGVRLPWLKFPRNPYEGVK